MNVKEIKNKCLPENGKDNALFGSVGCNADGAREGVKSNGNGCYVYVSGMSLVWCLSSNFYIDATFLLL